MHCGVKMAINIWLKSTFPALSGGYTMLQLNVCKYQAECQFENIDYGAGVSWEMLLMNVLMQISRVHT